MSRAWLIAGIGCRRDVSAAQIDAALHMALGSYSLADVRAIATVDAKAHEPGLLAFCASHALLLYVFTREQIAAFTSTFPDTSALSPPSPVVHAQLGVDGVCEPCALLAANGGPLIVGKIVCDGVTVALARDTRFDNRTAVPLSVGLSDAPNKNQIHKQDPIQ